MLAMFCNAWQCLITLHWSAAEQRYAVSITSNAGANFGVSQSKWIKIGFKMFSTVANESSSWPLVLVAKLAGRSFQHRPHSLCLLLTYKAMLHPLKKTRNSAADFDARGEHINNYRSNIICLQKLQPVSKPSKMNSSITQCVEVLNPQRANIHQFNANHMWIWKKESLLSLWKPAFLQLNNILPLWGWVQQEQ